MAVMQKVDFHFNVPDRLRYACAVAKTVLHRKLRLAVWTSNANRLGRLDALLWSYSDLAFLPHVAPGHRLAPDTPILLSTRLEELEGDVLLLLDDALPPDWQTAFERFPRIIDVVSTKPDELQASRARYRAYKAAGVELAAYDRRQ